MVNTQLPPPMLVTPMVLPLRSAGLLMLGFVTIDPG